MSLLNAPLFQHNLFSIPKSRPRKAISRSPFRLSSENLARELGPRYQTVDAQIGNQRMTLDFANGNWIPEETAETTIDSIDIAAFKDRKRALKKENKILQAKLEILLDMLAEVTAEEKLRRMPNQ